MTGLWSPQQQAWLKALGHRVLVLAGDEADVPAADPVDDARPASLPHPGEPRRVVRERHVGMDAPMDGTARQRPGEPPSAIDATPQRAMPADAALAGRVQPTLARAPDDALERALLSATGQRTRTESRAMLDRLGVDVQALRGNPAAKRALWLQLRPLRPRFHR